jgi:hypothetical protein
VNVLHHDEEWMDVFYRVFVCPQCPDARGLSELIPHLNDKHRWTREQIAQFVETIEQQASRTLVVDVQGKLELAQDNMRSSAC